MFGIAVARLDKVADAEKERYQALYCGLCLELKRRYGQVSRAALSYDLAFLAMFYDSLYEPREQQGATRCIAHPGKRMPYSISDFTGYCADLSVALAYHKCLDDISDDGSVKAKVARRALEAAYEQAQRIIPEQCHIVADAMDAIGTVERSSAAHPDAASIAFGEMLGFLVECVPGRFPDLWSEQLRDFGFWLGRFIYLMDAAVDFASDAETGSYNPFVKLAEEGVKTHCGARGGYTAGKVLKDALQEPDVEEMRAVLSGLIGRACDVFERLPLVQDVGLMRSVLYSGVWQKFNQTYEELHADA